MEKQQTAKPVIRFPEFTDHWNNTKLSELLKEAKKRNIKTLYLKTELVNYYEKFGAKYIKNIGKNEQLFKINVI